MKIWRQRGRSGSGSAEHLRTLLDEREIRRCILRYCHGTDRLDWQLVVECYVPGASDNHGSFNGSVEKLADWLADKSRHRAAKQHYIANQLIEIVGDAAVCESYYFCYIEFTGDPEFGGRQDPTAVIMGGRYVDRLRRYQDEWRIASRTVLIDWSRNLGRPVPWSAPAAAAFTPARQDGQDVAQLALTEMARLRSSRRRDRGERAKFSNISVDELFAPGIMLGLRAGWLSVRVEARARVGSRPEGLALVTSRPTPAESA